MVRFRQAAPFIEAWDISRPLALGARSGPGCTGRLDHYGAVAQLGERLLCKQDVEGSIPFSSTTDSKVNKIQSNNLWPGQER